MAIYWVDPFLEATTQGNGTTSTTTKDGSYASPFSWYDSDLLQENVSSASDITSLNGNTLADGDEIRIKGLPFSTLFQSLGEMYFEQIAYNTAKLKPITSNTDYANKGSSDVFCFDTTFTDYFLPTEARSSNKNWYFTTHGGTNSSTELITNRSDITLRLFYNCGFSSSSGGSITGGYNYPTVYQLKDTYSNKKSFTYYYNHWCNILNAQIQISSGWTSETARGGISILEYDHGADSYRYMNWFGGYSGQVEYGAYSELWLDCPELYIVNGGYTYTKISVNAFAGSNLPTTRTASLGGIVGRGYQTDIYISRLNDGANKTYIINQQQSYRSKNYYGNYGNFSGQAIVKIYLTDQYEQTEHNNRRVNTIKLKIGSQLTAGVNTNSSAVGTVRLSNEYLNYLNDFEHIEFLGGSFYTCNYYNTYYSWSGEFLAPWVFNVGLYTTTPTIVPTAPAAVYRATVSGSPLANMNYTNYRLYPPTAGGSLGTSSELHTMISMPISGNRWFDPALDFPRTHPLVNIPLSVLKCNSSDYRTASVDITTTLNSGSTGKFNTFNFDSNDYDNAPVTLLPSEGDAPPALLYNDTITGTGGNVNCLVIKHPKVSTSQNLWVFPMVINLPDDFDPTNSSKDEIRITYSVAQNSSWSGTAGYTQVYAFYKDMPNPANGYVGYISITSTDVSNPDTQNVTFSPTLGSNTPKQNSILIATRMRFLTNTTNDMKAYFTDISVSAV